MRFLFATVFMSVVVLSAPTATWAAPASKPAPTTPVVAPLSADEAAAKVEAYLSSLTTIVSDFNQVAPDGSLSGGKFYLKRPGKMRWQYAPPSPVLLVSDGKRIVYYDAELKQVTYIGMDDTLAGFLAQKIIKLESATTHLTHIEAAAGMIRATLVQKSKPNEGSLTLEFTDNPLELKQMTILDATGQTTHVQLQNATFGGEIDDKLFVFEDPRGIHKNQRP